MGSKARFLLSVAAAGLAFSHQAAQAQSAPANTAADDAGGEAIVVTGIRRSIQSSLETKRSADQIVDAVTAEDVGKLPDPTVADALQRVPGVQVTRNFGQGSRVVIRGLQSNIILINGRAAYGWPLESANGFGDNLGRNFGLESYASNLFGKLEVFKSAMASQIEGGLGGLVDARTYRASDFKTDTSVMVSGEGNVGSKLGKMGYSGTGLIAHKFSDRFQVLAGVTYSSSPVYLTGLTRGSWNEMRDPIDLNLDGKRDIIQTAIKSERFSPVWRNRLSVTGNFDLELADGLTLYADTTYSDLTINRDLYIGSFVLPTNATITNPTFSGNYIVAGTVNVPFRTQTNFRGEQVVTNTSSAGLKWESDKLDLNLQLSTTSGIFNQTNNLLEQATVNPVALSFDFRNGDFPDVSLSQADANYIASSGSYGAAGATAGMLQHLRVETQEKAAKFDAKLKLDGAFLNSIQFGARYSDLWQQRDQFNKNIGTYNANTVTGLINVGAAGVVTPQTNTLGSNFATTTAFYFPGFVTTFPLLNPSYLHDESSVMFTDKPFIYNPAQYFHTTEKTKAGYVQLNFDNQSEDHQFRGNIGLRVVNSRTEAAANAFSTTAGILSTTPVSYDNSYTNVLPSLNLSYNLDRALVTRLAVSKTIARQALDQNGLAPNLIINVNSITPSLTTASSGNPFLVPVKSTNVDLSLEWYFARTGVISANAFYKDVDGFPVRITQTTEVPGLESLGPIAYTRPINSDKGKIKGLELSYQHTFDFLPGMLSGLGVISSFTYIDAKTKLTYASGATTYTFPDMPLTGVSKYSYNVTGFYEKDGFNARLSWVWRSQRLYGLQSQGNGPSGAFDATNTGIRRQYIGANGSLDASVSYNFSENLNVYFNAANLLPKRSAPVYFTEQEAFLWRRDIGESRFTLGFRAKY